MGDATALRAFTKTLADEMMLAAQNPQPDLIVVSGYVRSVFVVTDMSIQEAWNWRRTKRELRRLRLVRKGVRREYHKRPKA